MAIRSDEQTGYVNIILRSERWLGLTAKWILLLIGVFGTSFREEYRLGLAVGGGAFPLLTGAVLIYALSNLVFTFLFVFEASVVRRMTRAICFASYAIDIAFASQIIYHSDGIYTDMYFLYALLALKSVIYYPAWRDVLAFPFALGPLYALLLRLSVGSWYFLTEPFFLFRYALLLGVVLAAVYLGWLNERGHLLEINLRSKLAERNLDLDNKTRTMQQMATSLGNRVLELRTLQEGIKAINSALALEDVLRLIVANASQVLEGARCSVALLAEGGRIMSTAATDGPLGSGLARESESAESRRLLGDEGASDGYSLAEGDGYSLAEGDGYSLAAGDGTGDALHDGPGLAAIASPAKPMVGTPYPLLGAAPTPEAASAEAMAGDGHGLAKGDGRAEFDRDVVRWIADHGEPVLISDIQQDGRFRGASRLTQDDVGSVISVPLFLDDRVIGALIATSPDEGVFTAEDASLLNAFADQAAVAVKNARLYEQLIREQRELERVYEHVEERRNELEAILRGIGDGVIVADPGLNLLLMNPVATRMFQVGPAVASNTPLSQVIPHQELTALFADALHGTDKAIVKEISLPSPAAPASRRPSGEAATGTTYQALASPISGADGKARGVVTVLRDVTTQKELERMKSNFLSVVSHELRTPLHSIKGFVEIILMGKTGPINETQADFLRTAREQTAHLQNLINDLLEFSRLESGQVKLRLSEVSLTEVAAAVADKLKPQADQGQISLVNRIGPEIPAIEADHLRIEQVLTNLVDNAIKFTSAAGIVTLSATDLGEEIEVTVSDTGIGIPAGEIERIFDRFYQVDGGSTRPYRGTGLGLTICKHIIEHHRGRIWAESEPGKGSTFHFVLPKRIAAQEEELLLDFLSLPKAPPD